MNDRTGSDRGSITVLVLGLFAVLLLLVAVVVDTSAAVLARRALVSAADGAASAAAQELDEAAVFRDGVGERVPLDAVAARAAVRRYQRDMAVSQPRIALSVRLDERRTRATVTAVRVVRLPFLGPLSGRSLTLRTSTTVTSPVR